MSLGYVGLLLPALELVTVWWLVSRIAYRRYPALLTHLVLEAVAQTAAILAWQWWLVAWASSQPVRLAIRFWIVAEVFGMACRRTTRRRRLILAGYAVTASLLCAGVVYYLVRLSPFESFALFRQYYLLILAGALCGITCNVRYRLAASSGWTATFTLLWDKTIVSRDQMRSVLNDAGTLVGLADGRSVGYGRFTVESFEILDAEEAATA